MSDILVPGEGPIPCDYMIVGEAPGREEIKQGRPFVGASGKLLDETLVLLGRKRSEFYITNVFKGDVGEGNPNPTDSQLDDHYPLLEQEFKDVEPSRVLLLGATAAREFYGEDFPGVGRLRGKPHVGFNAVWYYVTWHPSYVLRRRGETAIQFVNDIKRFISE